MHVPVAVHSIGVIITLIGVVDDPPDIITATSTNPNDSSLAYCSDSNSTTNSTQSVHKKCSQ